MVDKTSLPNIMLAFITTTIVLSPTPRSYVVLLSPSTFQEGEESLKDERTAQLTRWGLRVREAH
jgi:hypothetical protein